MPADPQVSQKLLNYKSVLIRLTPDDNWVNLSDLWKSEGSRSPLRPDKWAKQEENRVFLEQVADRTGNPGWIAFKGGKMQGTFATPEIAVRYAASLSLECHDWLCSILNTAEDTQKAKRRIIYLGSIPLEVFKLSTGEYRLSQTQVAEAIGKDELSFRQFLASKSPEALPYKGFHSVKTPVEDSNAPIKPIPVKLAIAYWAKESRAGNQTAITILAASANEAIERRADEVFGVHRSEEEYNRRFTAFDVFKSLFPEPGQATDSATVLDSMTLAEHDVFKKLKRKYPKEIFSLSKFDFIRDLILLGSETDNWHLTREKCFPYPEGAANRNAYPDLVSQVSEFVLGGRTQKVVLLLQAVDTIVDENHIKECVYLREYIDLVKDHLKVDHVLMFFVSPYGVTRYAAACIKERDELRNCVGVITVKQLSQFLLEKALQNKKDNIRAGKLRKRFKHLTEYKDLEELFGQEETAKLAIQAKALTPMQCELNLFSA